MTELTKSIPRRLYVARNDNRGADEILGFIVVADNKETKQFINAKAKADQWASSNFEELEFDNVPMTGFRIINNVSRYSTSNVVWRIEHPMGFEFEIYSDNFLELIKHCDINKGIISTELFLTQNKKLTGVGFPTYENVKGKDDLATKSKNTVIEVGSFLYTESIQVDKHGEEKGTRRDYGFYAGRFHTLKQSDYIDSVTKSSKLTHWVLDGNKFSIISDTEFKKAFVDDTKPKHVFSDCIHKEVHDDVITRKVPRNYYSSDVVIAVFNKPIKYNMFEIESDVFHSLYPNNLTFVKSKEDGTYRMFVRSAIKSTYHNNSFSNSTSWDTRYNYKNKSNSQAPHQPNAWNVVETGVFLSDVFEIDSFDSFDLCLKKSTTYSVPSYYGGGNAHAHSGMIYISDADKFEQEYEVLKLVFKGYEK